MDTHTIPLGRLYKLLRVSISYLPGGWEMMINAHRCGLSAQLCENAAKRLNGERNCVKCRFARFGLHKYFPENTYSIIALAAKKKNTL